MTLPSKWSPNTPSLPTAKIHPRTTTSPPPIPHTQNPTPSSVPYRPRSEPSSAPQHPPRISSTRRQSSFVRLRLPPLISIGKAVTLPCGSLGLHTDLPSPLDDHLQEVHGGQRERGVGCWGIWGMRI
ncbi:hypothetical protein D9758_015274 [Tetrapyrgos nigripes]|uniref:Uncharacterized protein n=1 Tax=Tetrapyrgos nigripes TaxID=182062 RepID=A0A8H5CNJ9_9AGAR|nr:hypothetical protein D9758_015274 [Tetrapyrgos nigripes]